MSYTNYLRTATSSIKTSLTSVTDTIKTSVNSVTSVSNSLKTSEGYYYIFYSNNELIHYKDTLVGKNNKITNFVNKLLEEDETKKFKFREPLNKILSFKNINSIFSNGFRLKYDGTKLKYNSFDNPKMKIAIHLIKNKNILNIICQKINISSIFNQFFDKNIKYKEIKENEKNKDKIDEKKKIIKLFDTIKKKNKKKNKKKKKKFI